MILSRGQRVLHTSAGWWGHVMGVCPNGCCAIVQPDDPWAAPREVEAWKLAPIHDNEKR